ncbi:glucan biosynthesis protein [Pyxidicoccus xibeiensis]|uniref:glucan biosynthesis protein n=1 Tax=Pyxidicoccus xibeiensis TaxID=2906759 RepID=UPI0020A71DA8|nr:glucan biosynthesis protein [Pyxidicoccus xibeiensis]MCP3144677.1 glucan biosynthesis protein [Pyxidicoccus xibeiensis]
MKSRRNKAWSAWVCAAVVASATAASARAAPAKPAASARAFPPGTVVERARALAARPYVAPKSTLPEAYQQLSYDAYRDIRYRDEKALWRGDGLPYQAQFFHPGFLYPVPVAVHVVEHGKAEPVRFSPELFTYGALVKPGPLAKADGFAGLKLTHPLNRAGHFDEVLSFLGASYFRALGRGTVYGLSARGVAIDTALPRPEEFPSFRELWLERPAPGADRVVVHALMDGPSLTGAYRFTVIPGASTVMEVEATLFARKAVEQLGLAPLTSMYLFGENDRGTYDDFRPEVHDSDGLFVWMREGEQLWRPLQNPSRVSVSSFRAASPRAFGLLQRDTAFTSYEDLEARYELRPSAWVEPVGDWGPGAVRLVELPTPQEVHDNIVAFWVPDAPLTPGVPLRVAYRLHWGAQAPWPRTTSAVTATRIAAGDSAGARRFVLDFSPEAGASRSDGPVDILITASRGQVLHRTVRRHEPSGGWRATFEWVPDAGAPSELRAYLRRGSETLTETWSYLWTP